MSTAASGTVADLTLTGNQCIVVLRDGAGRSLPPLTLMASNGNYNAIYSALLMASTNRYAVDLTSGSSGISMVKVRMV
jgi:hypothetical protein